ncbi:hypothetical protein GNI_204040, partial [Gregarina niphandrodes]
MSPMAAWEWVDAGVEFGRRTNSHSPTLTFVQASGCGKSRLVREMCLTKPLIYLSCAAKGTRSYPRRSQLLESLEVNNRLSLKSVVLSTACWAEKQQCGGEDWRRLLWETQADKSHLIEPAWDEDADWLSAVMRCRQALRLAEHDTLLIVCDEARTLLPNELFRKLRREVAELRTNRRTRLAWLCLDTCGRLSNFSPTAHNDPSLRPMGGPGSQLFPPNFTFTSPLARCKCYSRLSEATTSHALGAIGRPLWWSLADFEETNRNAFVREKIMGGATVSVERLSQPVVIAALLACTSWSIVPRRILGENLVASHMAIMSFCESDRETVHLGSASEPFLAAGAVSLLFERDAWFETSLRLISDALSTGLESKGTVGELVCNMLLLFCRCKVEWRSLFEPLSVTTFMAKLWPPGLVAEAEEDEEWRHVAQDFTLAFSGTILAQRAVNSRYLHTSLLNNSIIAACDNQPLYDFVLPVVRGDSLSEETITGIPVQIKNQQSSSIQGELTDSDKRIYEAGVEVSGDSDLSLLKHGVVVGMKMKQAAFAKRSPLLLVCHFGINKTSFWFGKISDAQYLAVINPVGSSAVMSAGASEDIIRGLERVLATRITSDAVLDK